MSNPRIEVDVVANVAGVASGVSAATSQLDKLGKAAKATAPKFENLAKTTSRYNSVGIDFARVIQDAPFGIIGVGNNIQQLAQSFSGLGQAGDSTKSKIKLAFGQIFSSGNALILGVSLLTTAFTILQQKGFFKTEEDARSLNERLKEYQETLTGVAAATLKGAQDAQKELAVLKSLEIQATNTAVSNDKRLEAVNELQKQYPDYFGNLTKEQILNGEVGDTYLKVAANLLAKAKAQAATNQIAQNGIELLRIETKLEEQRAKRLLETSAAQAQLDALIEKRQKEGFLTQGDLQRYDTLIKSINNSNESLKEEKTLKGEITRINKENEALTQNITKQIEAGGTLTNKSGEGIDANKEKLKEFSKGWDEYNLQQEAASSLQDKLTFGIKDYEKSIISTFQTTQKAPIVPDVTGDNAWDQYTMSVYQFQKAAFDAGEEVRKSANDALEFGERIKSLEGKEVKIKVSMEGLSKDESEKSPFDVFLDSLQLSIDKLPTLEQQVSDFAFTINDLLKNNVTDAFIDLGYSIGEALASGGNVLKAIGGSLLKSFSRFLGQFGEQLIAYGVAASAFGKVSVALATPGAAIIAAPLAIAAGIALTAIAGAIGSIGSKGPGGGGAGGGSAAPAGSSFTGGGVGGLFESQRDLNGELVVRGQDLVYVFGQANNKINKG